MLLLYVPRKRKDGTLERIVRAKWTMDDAETIEEMARKLEQKAEYVRKLEEDGWELEHPVQDDYAFLVKKDE